MCLVSLPAYSGWHGYLEKKKFRFKPSFFKTSGEPKWLNYVLPHIYICLVYTLLFDFHWHLSALGQQCVRYSYYIVPELALILLA